MQFHWSQIPASLRCKYRLCSSNEHILTLISDLPDDVTTYGRAGSGVDEVMDHGVQPTVSMKDPLPEATARAGNEASSATAKKSSIRGFEVASLPETFYEPR